MESGRTYRSRLPGKQWRYTLRGVSVFFAIFGASLGIACQVNPLWGALFFAYTLLAYCFSRSAIRGGAWFPLAFATLHTILFTIVAVIDYTSAWDDMSPTMLVLFAVYIVDYPIHWAYTYLGLFPNGLELWYGAQLVVAGGLLWLGVGMLLQMVWSALSNMIRRIKRGSTESQAGIFLDLII